MATSKSTAISTTRNTIAFLNLPAEIRQQILLLVCRDRNIMDTIELKAYKVLPASPDPVMDRYEAKWQSKPITIDRLSNPRVMCNTTSLSCPLVEFACRWNVPAPLFAFDYQYIDKRWSDPSEKQASPGAQKVNDWNEIFGSQFHINWVENFKPHVEGQKIVVGSRQVSPLGSNVYIQGAGERHRGPCPNAVLSKDLSTLWKAVRRSESSASGRKNIYVQGWIKVDAAT